MSSSSVDFDIILDTTNGLLHLRVAGINKEPAIDQDSLWELAKALCEKRSRYSRGYHNSAEVLNYDPQTNVDQERQDE